MKQASIEWHTQKLKPALAQQQFYTCTRTRLDFCALWLTPRLSSSTDEGTVEGEVALGNSWYCAPAQWNWYCEAGIVKLVLWSWYCEAGIVKLVLYSCAVKLRSCIIRPASFLLLIKTKGLLKYFYPCIMPLIFRPALTYYYVISNSIDGASHLHAWHGTCMAWCSSLSGMTRHMTHYL